MNAPSSCMPLNASLFTTHDLRMTALTATANEVLPEAIPHLSSCLYISTTIDQYFARLTKYLSNR
jgi:hypothetical protein